MNRFFLECFVGAGLHQWVQEPTVTSGNILDLFLTSEDDRVGVVQVLEPFPHCIHSPIVMEYVFNFSVNIGPYIGIKLLNISNGS